MTLPNPASASSSSKTRPSRFAVLQAWFQHIIAQQQARMANVITDIKTLKISQWVSQYTPSQLCYFAATLLLLISIFTEMDFLPATAIIAFLGLIRELLNLFNRIWATTLGKSLTLITYASTANLALAFAALKINLITGVEPMPFVFTLGFSTLILMPFWIALSSVVMFLCVLIIANAWLLISIPLRLIGLPVVIHWEDTHRALLTMLMRIVLIPIVLVHLFNIMLPYIGQDVFDEPISISLNNDNESDTQTDKTEVAEATEALLSAPSEAQSQEQQDPLHLRVQEQEQDELINRQRFIENLIADFIFYFEAYPYSACVKEPEQKSVILDDYTVLLITKNSEALHGYDFIVAKCIGRHTLGAN